MCLKNISINTLHKGDDDDNSNDNNNNYFHFSGLKCIYIKLTNYLHFYYFFNLYHT